MAKDIMIKNEEEIDGKVNDVDLFDNEYSEWVKDLKSRYFQQHQKLKSRIYKSI